MKLIPALLFIACLLVASCQHPADVEERKIVQLIGDQGSCSGFQVEGKSGNHYILTAAHCGLLAGPEGSFTVLRADGSKLKRKLIATAEAGDLLLLEGLPNQDAFAVASEEYPKEHIHVIGHGLGLPTYRADGVLIGSFSVFGFEEIASTAVVAPGHSGSPVIDDNGQVVGVVSVGNPWISGFVSLKDIQSFTAGY